jgi:hypothetical protein
MMYFHNLKATLEGRDTDGDGKDDGEDEDDDGDGKDDSAPELANGQWWSNPANTMGTVYYHLDNVADATVAYSVFQEKNDGSVFHKSLDNKDKAKLEETFQSEDQTWELVEESNVPESILNKFKEVGGQGTVEGEIQAGQWYIQNEEEDDQTQNSATFFNIKSVDQDSVTYDRFIGRPAWPNHKGSTPNEEISLGKFNSHLKNLKLIDDPTGEGWGQQGSSGIPENMVPIFDALKSDLTGGSLDQSQLSTIITYLSSYGKTPQQKQISSAISRIVRRTVEAQDAEPVEQAQEQQAESPNITKLVQMMISPETYNQLGVSDVRTLLEHFSGLFKQIEQGRADDAVSGGVSEPVNAAYSTALPSLNKLFGQDLMGMSQGDWNQIQEFYNTLEQFRNSPAGKAVGAKATFNLKKMSAHKPADFETIKKQLLQDRDLKNINLKTLEQIIMDFPRISWRNGV